MRSSLVVVALFACGTKEPPPELEPAVPEPKPQPEPQPKPVEPPKPVDVVKLPELGPLPAPWKRVNESGSDLIQIELTRDKGVFFQIQIRELESTAMVQGEPPPPMEPDKYGDWIAAQLKRKVTKKEKLGEAVAYDYSYPEADGKPAYAFAVYVKVGTKLWSCDGYDQPFRAPTDTKDIQMTKELVADVKSAIAAGKKICATLH